MEKLPTKKQLLATIAMLAKQPATKLATSIRGVPTMLATAIKKVRVLRPWIISWAKPTSSLRVLPQVSELDEDKSKLVSSVVKTA